MAQRVRIPHRGQGPSSVTQLPILTALHARSPTLFTPIIHEKIKNVNPQFQIFLFHKDECPVEKPQNVCILGVSAHNAQKLEMNGTILFNLMKKL